MPLDSRNIEALHLGKTLRIELHPRQEEPYRSGSHRGRTLSEVLENLIQELG